MNLRAQDFIILSIVLAAAAVMATRMWRAFIGTPGKECSCSGCPAAAKASPSPNLYTTGQEIGALNKVVNNPRAFFISSSELGLSAKRKQVTRTIAPKDLKSR